MQDFVTLHAFGYTARIRLEGAQIVSLITPDGREVIWQGNPDVWPQHSTILFPICGAAKNDEVIIGGKAYPMSKHGFTKVAPFTVAKQGEDFVELVYAANDETLSSYPFNFVFHATYTLLDGGYTTTFLVENLDEKAMPFCLGGHPGFVCPMEDGADFEDYQLVFDEIEEGRNSLVPGGGMIDGWEYLPGFHNARVLPLRYETFDHYDTLLFAGLRSRGVNLVHKHSGKGLRLTFPKFPVLAIWTATGKRAPYICLEPWQGMPAGVGESGRMEEKPYAVILEAGKCYKTWFTATLI